MKVLCRVASIKLLLYSVPALASTPAVSGATRSAAAAAPAANAAAPCPSPAIAARASAPAPAFADSAPTPPRVPPKAFPVPAPFSPRTSEARPTRPAPAPAPATRSAAGSIPPIATCPLSTVVSSAVPWSHVYHTCSTESKQRTDVMVLIKIIKC